MTTWMGKRPIGSIRRQDVRQLITDLRGKGLRLARVRGIVRSLSTVVAQAVEDDVLPANPALRIGRCPKQAGAPITYVAQQPGHPDGSTTPRV